MTHPDSNPSAHGPACPDSPGASARQRSLVVLTVAVLVAAVGACGGGQEPLAPHEAAAEGFARRIDRALDRAVEGTANPGVFATELRYNPAECECPPWEVELAARWARVELVAARNAGAPVHAFLESPSTAPRRADVLVTRETQNSSTGWHYRVVEVVALPDVDQ